MADLPPSLMLVGVVRVAELRCLAHISLETRGGGSTTEAASSQELGPGCLAPTGYFFSLTVTLNLTVPLEPPPDPLTSTVLSSTFGASLSALRVSFALSESLAMVFSPSTVTPLGSFEKSRPMASLKSLRSALTVISFDSPWLRLVSAGAFRVNLPFSVLTSTLFSFDVPPLQAVKPSRDTATTSVNHFFIELPPSLEREPVTVAHPGAYSLPSRLRVPTIPAQGISGRAASRDSTRTGVSSTSVGWARRHIRHAPGFPGWVAHLNRLKIATRVPSCGKLPGRPCTPQGTADRTSGPHQGNR